MPEGLTIANVIIGFGTGAGAIVAATGTRILWKFIEGKKNGKANGGTNGKKQTLTAEQINDDYVPRDICKLVNKDTERRFDTIESNIKSLDDKQDTQTAALSRIEGILSTKK